ncbi:MAG: hypothetical protein ACO32Q_08480 [Burkholderiaceae bacterium]
MLNDLSGFSDAVLSTRLDAAWFYDQRTGRYRNERGRFLSQKAVETLVDGRIDKLDATLRRVTKMMAEGNITLDQWQGSVREAIKAAHIQAAIIGHGGKDSMGASEYGRIGQRLRSEYAFLQNFANEILGGRISAPMAVARISLYAHSVRGSYWQGLELRKQSEGYGMMRRILDPQAQHCSDCPAYAARGIVPLGTLPMPGQRCACRSRCRCTVQFYRQQMPVSPV